MPDSLGMTTCVCSARGYVEFGLSSKRHFELGVHIAMFEVILAAGSQHGVCWTSQCRVLKEANNPRTIEIPRHF